MVVILGAAYNREDYDCKAVVNEEEVYGYRSLDKKFGLLHL